MIGRFVIAGLVTAVAGLSQANAANNPLKTWQGGATLTAINATCTSKVPGFSVGDLAHSIFRPRLVNDEPVSALTMIFTRSALSFFKQAGGAANDQMHGAGTYKGHWISGRATSTPAGTGTAGNFNFVVAPTTITTAVPQVDISGTITNFAGAAGCQISFRGSYNLRP
jgi:hypothetical protein